MLYALLIILALLIAYAVFNYFRQKRYLNVLTQEEFINGYRKAQLIDVREQNEFERGHIRGARNIPLTTFKQSINGLRADKPVYLYCQNTTRSSRAAAQLKKHNFENINILQGGFKKWSGKIDYKK
ncbi:MAG TPA: rhodanese-like domain-containing protein [Pseudogracilibacillus sp.]|nr:rhodanese-like domain-containing protein [Pseudogracilibacillus sp.]